MATNFEPDECVIFAQSLKIGTHENKAMLILSVKIGILSFYLYALVGICCKNLSTSNKILLTPVPLSNLIEIVGVV